MTGSSTSLSPLTLGLEKQGKLISQNTRYVYGRTSVFRFKAGAPPSNTKTGLIP